ncbi:MAG: hypothetical protein HY608_10550 [Planctomycetes bacterium]|nr:hypothetical protein [Planctomycetota bacterium]
MDSQHRPGDASLGPHRLEAGGARWTGVLLGGLVLAGCLWGISFVNGLGERWDEVYQDYLEAGGQSIEHQSARLFEGWASSMAYVFAGGCAAMCVSRSYGARVAGVLGAGALLAVVCLFAGNSYASEWEHICERDFPGGRMERIRFGLDPEGAKRFGEAGR